MPTLSERILTGGAGEYVDREVDRAYVHDGTGVLTYETFRALGVTEVSHPDRKSVV